MERTSVAHRRGVRPTYSTVSGNVFDVALPSASEAVTVTLYGPMAAQVCVTVGPWPADVPSPKSHVTAPIGDHTSNERAAQLNDLVDVHGGGDCERDELGWNGVVDRHETSFDSGVPVAFRNDDTADVVGDRLLEMVRRALGSEVNWEPRASRHTAAIDWPAVRPYRGSHRRNRSHRWTPGTASWPMNVIRAVEDHHVGAQRGQPDRSRSPTCLVAPSRSRH